MGKVRLLFAVREKQEKLKLPLAIQNPKRRYDL